MFSSVATDFGSWTISLCLGLRIYEYDAIYGHSFPITLARLLDRKMVPSLITNKYINNNVCKCVLEAGYLGGEKRMYRFTSKVLFLLCSHSPNDAPPNLSGTYP